MSSPEVLERLAAYVPTPVAQVICQQPHILTRPTEQRLPAAVLFVDISGFTALSELLSRAGPTGAEELTQLINTYFTRIIQTIEIYQGQVVKFSGDALMVLFPAEETALPTAARRAGPCGLTIQARMCDSLHLNTSQGAVSLSMRVGIGAGEVLVCNVGGLKGRWEYVVGGDPLVQVSTAEGRAKPGQVVFSPQAWREAGDFFAGTSDSQGFVSLNQDQPPSQPPSGPVVWDWYRLNDEALRIAEQALKCYVPGAIKARLQSQSDWLAELRRMTILFTGLGGLDYEAVDAPERLQNLVHATQKITYDLEGALDKVTVDDKGTVIIILFGAPPFSHEDDAQRAVACALRLQAVAQEQNLRMSIGITEGSIFAGPVGAPSRQEYTVIGDHVNLAARLMQHGRHGSIIISEQVKERIKTRFTTESLGHISVKGKTRALQAYQVHGEEGAQLQFVSRYFSKEEPLIGRKAELEQIRRMASRARAGKLQVLFIEGELGLGKSRLVSEMVREWTMGAGAACGSKCSSYGRHIPYQGWEGILAAIYGLTSDLTPQRQLARLANAVAALPDPPEQPGYWADRLPLLEDVMGLDIPDNAFTRTVSGKLRRNNTFALVEALLRHQSTSHSLLIILEDIHWADELSLSLATHLAKTLPNAPLFLAFVYRPMSPKTMRLLAPIQDQAYARVIELQPFSTDESLDMINILLGDKSIPEEARQVLHGLGQGNPFFLQEITRTMLSVMERQTDQPFSLSETLDLPSTVQDAILTRIDRLPEAEKLTLKIAAVIGTNFERSLLSAVHPVRQTYPELALQLDDLEEEKLIRLEIPDPKWEYAFRSVITQEVVYEGLLLAQRRQLHTTIGDTLEQATPDEIERLAFHYKRGSNLKKGLQYLTQAAQKSRREYANQTAIAYYSQALDFITNPPEAIATQDLGNNGNGAKQRYGNIITPEYWDILLERAGLYNLVGQRDSELEDLGTLGILAEALNDNRRRALAARQWAHFYETEGDYDSGLEMIERSVQLAQQAEDELLVGDGYNRWGRLLYLRGDYEIAREYLERALRIVQNNDDQTTLAKSLHNQGIVAFYQAKYDIARIYFQEAVDLWQALEDQVGLGNSLQYLGLAYYKTGHYMASRGCYNHCLALHRKMGDWAGEALTRHNLGQVLRSLGNYDLAKDLLAEALSMHQTSGNRRREANSLTQLGFLYGRLDDHLRALDHLEKGLSIIRELKDPWSLSDALTYYSWILTESGEPREAKTHLQEVLQIERDLKHGADKARIMENIILLGRVALARNDFSLADTCARHATTFLAQQGTSGVEHPAMVYLTIYQILQANNHLEEAQSILERGKNHIAGQAAQIDDSTLRQTYLNNIPENRELQALA